MSNDILQVDEFQISTVMTPFHSKEGLTLKQQLHYLFTVEIWIYQLA